MYAQIQQNTRASLDIEASTRMTTQNRHTFTFSSEDKCSVVCDDLELQFSDTGHIGDEGSGDDPLRIHILQHTTHTGSTTL